MSTHIHVNEHVYKMKNVSKRLFDFRYTISISHFLLLLDYLGHQNLESHFVRKLSHSYSEYELPEVMNGRDRHLLFDDFRTIVVWNDATQLGLTQCCLIVGMVEVNRRICI